MNQNNNQDNLIKLLQDSQKNNRDQKIINACTVVLMAIPTFILVWKSFKSKKPDKKVRLIRKEGQIAKTQLRHQAEMAQLQLDKQIILKEAAYENERLKLETGLDSESSLPQVKENKLDIFSSLKKQGENLVKDKVNQFSKVAGDKINEVAKTIKPKGEEN